MVISYIKGADRCIFMHIYLQLYNHYITCICTHRYTHIHNGICYTMLDSFIVVFTNKFVVSSCAQKLYCIVGIFDGGESLVNLANHLQFDKLKPSKLVVTINNLLADLFIRQTLSPKSSSIHFHQTLSLPNFPLYGIHLYIRST